MRDSASPLHDEKSEAIYRVMNLTHPVSCRLCITRIANKLNFKYEQSPGDGAMLCRCINSYYFLTSESNPKGEYRRLMIEMLHTKMLEMGFIVWVVLHH